MKALSVANSERPVVRLDAEDHDRCGIEARDASRCCTQPAP
jgi:hypothetical protein